jgi:hypothetical protein
MINPVLAVRDMDRAKVFAVGVYNPDGRMIEVWMWDMCADVLCSRA